MIFNRHRLPFLILALGLVAFGSYSSPAVRIQPIRVAPDTAIFAKEDSLDRGQPMLYRQIAIPEAFLTTSDSLTYGGDIRMGDMTGDEQTDFLVYRAALSVEGGAVQPCFIGAFTQRGDTLWHRGEGGQQPNRPGPVAIHDIDHDGSAEVITLFAEDTRAVNPHSMQRVSIQVLDGATGQLERQASPPELTSSQGEGPNWVHQRILIANLRGTEVPQDFVIKLGKKIIAFDHQLRVLWTYENQWDEYANCPAYVPAVGDMDGDGRDEINGGYFVLRADGTPRWERKLGRNMDAVAIDYWDSPLEKRAFCSGFGYVMSQRGDTVLHLGEAVVPHGQELRVARFDASVPGPQMMIRYRGHRPDVLLVGQEGKVIRRFQLNDSPNHTGMEAVYWNGPDQPAHLYNGGLLWNGRGKSLPPLPGLPEPVGSVRQGWYHCIPANVGGDRREEVVLYNPWDRYIWIYTPAPLDEDAFVGYRAAPRQYNVRLMD